ncbi:MAG: spermidine/putrescine ABC transporter substrate-binding protein [Ardenticatenales bacterium]|nr:spermidine/putrescine ABC transporter substrate-binding protein [Ardenticatenales bacterium]
MRKGLPWGLLVLMVLVALSACTANGSEDVSVDATPEAFMGNCERARGPLSVYMWSEELVPEVLEGFEALYGIEVRSDTYTSNEEMIERLSQGDTGYDVVFPSDYAVQQMVGEGMLERLDKENIPNRENLTTVLAYYYDPSNEYSMPFQWGTTGIAYNSKYVDPPPDSWAVLFDPAIAGAYAGKISMLDDSREVLGAALLYLGYSVNDTDPTHLAAARALVESQQPLLAGYDSEHFSRTLVNEDVYLAQAWGGQVALAASQNDAIRYVIPKEGAIIWMDNMAIPKGAPFKCTAELFINYLLQPEIAAQVSSKTFYNSPIPAASPLLDEATQEVLSKGFLISNETINRLQWTEYGPGAEIYETIWAEIR